ncbi:hypothetical protein Avbf_18808 [Armadillidium vulgare]|nr:hypothetical protein Avbf_18808 [Armadillidium vulgare]
MASSQGAEKFCKNCCCEFDDKYTSKKLECNHTFCLQCIYEKTKCPECREVIREPFCNLPQNLNISEILKSGSLEDLEKQKKRFATMINKDWNLFNRVPILKTPVDIPFYYSFDSLLESSDAESVTSPRPPDVNNPPCNEPSVREDFSLRSIQNKEEFIDKIVAELLNGNKIYAFDRKSLSVYGLEKLLASR